MVHERSAVLEEDRWNVEDLYPNVGAWEESFRAINKGGENRSWLELASYKGRVGESAEVLRSALDLVFSLDRQLSKLYTYAHLRHDEEISDDQHKNAYNRIASLIHDFSREIAWFEPEILALPEDVLHKIMASPELNSYRFHLEKIIRIKKHTLSSEKEELIALAGKAMQTPHKAFSAINDADFKFGVVLDSNDQEKEMTHGLYGLYLCNQDRVLRKNAFKKMHLKYAEYENTLCELLNGQVQEHLFNARARQYGSCLEAALLPKNIDTTVYHSLIAAVHEKIDVLHNYIALRQRMLGVSELHLYDMYVPLTSQIEMRISYKEAENLVIESTAPLGSYYQNLLRKGLKDQRWVDRYENKNKRSGAYSSGCYDSMPYILMNYKELLRDVFVLAHEAGHSMHSLLSHTNQPYHYSNYPIFLAEVASIFNEELLMRLMLERSRSKEETIYLINQKIDDIRTTLFRQTMFAEFELAIHEMAENDIPLTPKLLREEYRKLNRFYFGYSVVIDEEAEMEWARIPHFYYNFYVFQYATGISAALALAEKLMSGGEGQREAYLSFLKGGCSQYPIDMLQTAGINMRSPLPVKAAITKFGNYVDQLAKLFEG